MCIITFQCFCTMRIHVFCNGPLHDVFGDPILTLTLYCICLHHRSRGQFRPKAGLLLRKSLHLQLNHRRVELLFTSIALELSVCSIRSSGHQARDYFAPSELHLIRLCETVQVPSAAPTCMPAFRQICLMGVLLFFRSLAVVVFARQRRIARLPRFPRLNE